LDTSVSTRGKQGQPLEIALVGAQRDFVLGAAVDEVEQRAREPAAGQPAEVFDVGNDHGSLFVTRDS
jgi:hypothetical protein